MLSQIPKLDLMGYFQREKRREGKEKKEGKETEWTRENSLQINFWLRTWLIIL